MVLVKRFLVVCLLVLILTACSSLAQPTATPVPTLTLTAVPTRTATSTPTRTPLPSTETPAVASAWEGIPIMPDAVTGDGDEEGYVFTIQATPQQIQEYYELELGKLGWTSSVQEPGDGSLILTFTNNASVMLTVSIITKGDDALVLLVK